MFINIFLSGVLYYTFDYRDLHQFYVTDEFAVMGAWHTLLAVQVLWIAFYMFREEPYGLFAKFELRSVPMRFVHILVLIFLLSFFIGVYTETFGYVADPNKVKFVSYIRYGQLAGLVAIILMAAYYHDSFRHRLYLYAIVGANMIVGLLFGSKSTVVMPVVIYIFTQYMCERKISKTAVGVFIGGIVVAYNLVEPFRTYYGIHAYSHVLTGVTDLANVFVAAKQYTGGAEINYINSFIERQNYVVMLGKTIEYADLTSYYRTEEWGDLALSLFYGAIPRFLWESKPLADFGLWVSVNIFNLPPTSHIGITPQGYSYLVWRVPGIIVCFTLYGCIQRIGFNMFYVRSGLLPVFIYFYFFVLYPSYPTWTAISSFVQNLLIIAVCLLVFKLMAGKAYLETEQSRAGAYH